MPKAPRPGSAGGCGRWQCRSCLAWRRQSAAFSHKQVRISCTHFIGGCLVRFDVQDKRQTANCQPAGGAGTPGRAGASICRLPATRQSPAASLAPAAALAGPSCGGAVCRAWRRPCAALPRHPSEWLLLRHLSLRLPPAQGARNRIFWLKTADAAGWMHTRPICIQSGSGFSRGAGCSQRQRQHGPQTE